jgi:hypothetical protein
VERELRNINERADLVVLALCLPTHHQRCFCRGLYEDQAYELTGEQRREIRELGFPDDGYNYLRHVRDLGAGAAAQRVRRERAAAAAAVAAQTVSAPQRTKHVLVLALPGP